MLNSSSRTSVAIRSLKSVAVLLLAALFCAGLAADPALGQSSAQPIEEDLFLLEGPFIGSVGSQAVYVVSLEEYLDLYNPSNPDAWGTQSYDETRALLAQYTVLEPEPDTDAARLLVRAYAIDPHTYKALTADGWEAVYALRGTEAVWLGGSSVPDDYAGLFRPDWLTDWNMSRDEDRPKGAVRPGDYWFSSAAHPLATAADLNVPLQVYGEFVQWDTAGEFGSAAHIQESGHGVGTFPVAPPEGWSELGDAEFYWERNHVFIPGSFPGFAEQWLQVEGEFAPGLVDEPSWMMVLGAVAFYDRYPSEDFPWPPVPSATTVDYLVLEPGVPTTAYLGSESEVLTDGTYVDTYLFVGSEGEEIALSLASEDFDSYLFLLDDREERLLEDDDSGGGLDALIRYTLPYTGTYHVWVNTWSPGEEGVYTLTLDLLEPFNPEGYPGLSFGAWSDGNLGPGSLVLDDGSYAEGWSFAGEQGQRISLRMLSDHFDAYLVLMDESGELLASDDDSDGDLNARIVHTLPYSGTYVVWATAWSPGVGGDYALGLEFVELVDMTNYTPITAGVPATGMLGAWSEAHEDGTYMDRYRFQATAGDRIALGLESTDFDPYLFLVDDSGEVVATDDDSGGEGNALLRATLPYDGEYGVWVNTWAGGERGMYTLTLDTLGPFDLDEALSVLALLKDPERLAVGDLTRIDWVLQDLTELFWDVWWEKMLAD